MGGRCRGTPGVAGLLQTLNVKVSFSLKGFIVSLFPFLWVNTREKWPPYALCFVWLTLISGFVFAS